MSVKQVVAVVGLIFAVTLAVVVGQRMSAEAMAVVIGIICGVAASVPTSVIILTLVSRRERQRFEESAGQARRGDHPPVIVIQGGTSQALPPGSQPGYWPSSPPQGPVERQFHIVGGEELRIDGGG